MTAVRSEDNHLCVEGRWVPTTGEHRTVDTTETVLAQFGPPRWLAESAQESGGAAAPSPSGSDERSGVGREDGPVGLDAHLEYTSMRRAS